MSKLLRVTNVTMSGAFGVTLERADARVGGFAGLVEHRLRLLVLSALGFLATAGFFRARLVCGLKLHLVGVAAKRALVVPVDGVAATEQGDRHAVVAAMLDPNQAALPNAGAGRSERLLTEISHCAGFPASFLTFNLSRFVVRPNKKAPDRSGAFSFLSTAERLDD